MTADQPSFGDGSASSPSRAQPAYTMACKPAGATAPEGPRRANEGGSPLTSLFSPDFTPGAAAGLATTLKALADPCRLRILSVIHFYGEMTVAKIMEKTGIAETTIGHHVRLLAEAELICRRRAGTRRWCTLNKTALADLAALLRPPQGNAR